jgi:uncharacterized protein YggE
MRKYRDQARAMAIRAAREKARAIAGAVDCKVGHPRTIQEGAQRYWYWGGNSNVNATATAQNTGERAAADGVSDETEVMPPGQIEVRTSVSVVFDLLTL